MDLRNEIKRLIRDYSKCRFAVLTGSYVTKQKKDADLDLLIVYSDKFNREFSREYSEYQKIRGFKPDLTYPCEIINEEFLDSLIDIEHAINNRGTLKKPIPKNPREWDDFNLALLYSIQLMCSDDEVVDGDNRLLKSFRRRGMIFLSQLFEGRFDKFKDYILSPLEITLTKEIESSWDNVKNLKGLFFCDAGDTLIYPAPIYDLFNEGYNLWEEDNEIYALYKNGEINSEELFRRTIKLYKKNDITSDNFNDISKKIRIRRDLSQILENAREEGWYTICISGGFKSCLDNRVAHLFDKVIANKVFFDDGKIIDGEYVCSDEEKNTYISRISRLAEVSYRDIVYVGDEISDSLVRDFLKKNEGRYVDIQDIQELDNLICKNGKKKFES